MGINDHIVLVLVPVCTQIILTPITKKYVVIKEVNVTVIVSDLHTAITVKRESYDCSL